MSAALASLCIFAFLCVISNHLLFSLIVVLILGLSSKKVNKTLLLIGLCCLSFRFMVYNQPDFFNQGRVVELNEKSVLIQNGFNKILVTDIDPSNVSLGDVLRIDQVQPFEEEFHMFGFNLSTWAQANTIIAQASYVSTLKKANQILRWLSFEQASANSFQMWYRYLLFQVSNDSLLTSLFSLGLLYSSLIFSLEKKLSTFKYKEVIIWSFILGLLYFLGQPLSLIRIAVFRAVKNFIKQKDCHFFIQFILLFLIQPLGFTQLAWVIPSVLSAIDRFSFNPFKKIERIIGLNTFFLAFSLPVSFVYSLLYPSLRKILPYLLVLCLSARFNTQLQSFFVMLMNFMNQSLFQIKSLFQFNGHISFLSWLLILFLYQVRLKPMIWITMMIILIFVINPLSILPFFDQITMINVGQGDSFLFQSAFNQEVILLDTGNSYSYDQLYTLLNAMGIDHIDALILSHEDADHSANKDALNNAFKIDKIITQGEDVNFSSTSLKFLDVGDFSTTNDNSLMYYLNHQGISFLFLADVSSFVENQLIKTYPNLKVDVLKLAHHGSKTSTSLDLLHQLEAKFGLLSVGNNNYGHPSWTVLENCELYHLKLFNTKTNGDVIFRFVFNQLWIEDSNGNVWLTLTQ